METALATMNGFGFAWVVIAHFFYDVLDDPVRIFDWVFLAPVCVHH
jgi:hypothetical protein